MKRDEAMKMRSLIEKGVGMLEDADASVAPSLSPALTCDETQTDETPVVSAGTRICWNGQLKRARVTLWDTAANNPDNAPELWDDIDYRDGARVIHDDMAATLAFTYGENGWWDGSIYKSLMEGNTHTPAAAPNVWELIE